MFYKLICFEPISQESIRHTSVTVVYVRLRTESVNRLIQVSRSRAVTWNQKRIPVSFWNCYKLYLFIPVFSVQMISHIKMAHSLSRGCPEHWRCVSTQEMLVIWIPCSVHANPDNTNHRNCYISLEHKRIFSELLMEECTVSCAFYNEDYKFFLSTTGNRESISSMHTLVQSYEFIQLGWA